MNLHRVGRDFWNEPGVSETGADRKAFAMRFDNVHRMSLIPEIFRFHAWLRAISPMIWRRILLSSDQTVADLHYSLPLAFGWSDSQPHRFRVPGKDFGVYHLGGVLFDDGRVLFTSPEEPMLWNDLMTGLESRSLGAEEYRLQLSAVGFSVTSEYEG